MDSQKQNDLALLVSHSCLGQGQRVSQDVGDVLEIGVLIVVGQDDGLAFGLEAFDLFEEV